MRREIVGLVPFICGTMLLCSHFVNAQNGQIGKENREALTNAAMELIIEAVINNNNREEGANEEYYNELTQYLLTIAAKGLFLNNAALAELEYYGIINSFEWASLKKYISEHGNPLSFAELLLIPGVDREKIKLLQPFLRFSNSYYTNQGATQFFSTLLLRSSVILEKRDGYTPISKEEYLKKPESRYLGNPFLLYGQYRIDAPSNISAIITTKQDPGERGIDYLSWSAVLKNRGVLENLIIGSYTARKGQGLILWNGFSLSSSWDPASTIKRDYGLTPYTSSQEDRAFKGIAATISKGRFTIDMLTSLRNYDARITKEGYTSLLNTGLHNTQLTLQRKGTLHSKMAATVINYSNELLSLGTIVSASYNSLPYAGKDSSLILMEQKIGQWRSNIGMNWKCQAKRAASYGELAFDICGNAAATSGVAIRLKSGSELSFIGQYYNPYFVSPFSYISKIPGKNRFLTGFSGKFLLRKNITLYTTANLASNYYKIIMKCDISTQRDSKSEIRFNLYKERGNLRIDYRKNLSNNLLSHSRVDLSMCSKEQGVSLGYLMQQELIASFLKEKISGSCRLSWFSVPHWGNRIYSYERDVLNQFRTTLMYGHGFRWYFNVKVSLTTKIDAWLKYSTTYYTDRDTIGEGPETISGPSKSEVKAEVRIKF